MARVRSGQMPPAGGKLSEVQIAAIETWIRDGAVAGSPGRSEADGLYWAFQPVSRGRLKELQKP